jgi:hypothetical protein
MECDVSMKSAPSTPALSKTPARPRAATAAEPASLQLSPPNNTAVSEAARIDEDEPEFLKPTAPRPAPTGGARVVTAVRATGAQPQHQQAPRVVRPPVANTAYDITDDMLAVEDAFRTRSKIAAGSSSATSSTSSMSGHGALNGEREESHFEDECLHNELSEHTSDMIEKIMSTFQAGKVNNSADQSNLFVLLLVKFVLLHIRMKVI